MKTVADAARLFKRLSLRGKAIVIAIAFVLFLLVGYQTNFIRDRIVVSTITATIKTKYPKRIGGDSYDTYHVYVTYADGSDETLVNRDSWWNFKTNSADVQNRLAEGKTYKLKVTGVRLSLFSWFRNIVDSEEVKTSANVIDATK